MEKDKDHKKHPFHLVHPSPWPFVGSLAALTLGIGGVLAMHQHGIIPLLAGIGLLIFTMAGWWWDVTREAGSGVHTSAVQRGFRYGMGLFILSELMFFFAFFWAFFHASLFPSSAIGGVWPPKGIHPLNPFGLPYLNTLILLLSGTTITWAHLDLLDGNIQEMKSKTGFTILLGLFFTLVQGFEYAHAHFSLNGGIYPSTFYLATGFHGLHVIIGTLFLAVCWLRARAGHFTADDHFGFEAAAWYWHFVDVVWLFLFVSIYWWGAGGRWQ